MATTASPPPAPPSKPQFVFINDTHPEDAKSKTKRRLVRAQAARGPHSITASTVSNRTNNYKAGPPPTKHQALKRTKKDRANTTTFPLSLVGLDDVKALPQEPFAKTSPIKEDAVIVQVKDKGLQPTTSLERQRGTSSSSYISPGTTTLQESAVLYDNDESSSSNPTASIVPKMPGTGWAAPFVSHPDPKRSYFPMLLHHCESDLLLEQQHTGIWPIE